MRVCEQILDLARWAPSGDNTQPWRFEIRGELEVVVHGFDTRDHCVYDLDGHPSQMALGALLETMRIAATGHGLRTEVTRRVGLPDETPTFDVRFVADPSLRPSPLIPFITVRAVQRRPLSTKPLTVEQKSVLEASVAPDYQIVWLKTRGERWRVAKLLFRNAKLRLTMREAFEVHRSVIEWNARFSEDKIPDQAVGVDPLTAKLMHWVMQSWPRVEFFNTWLAGTLMPRLQLDLLPGVACAAHFGLGAQAAPVSIDDYVAAGRAMQRCWLEAARLGLWLQPEMTPVIFGRYHRERIAFTSSAAARALAATVASGFEALLGTECVRRLVFFARVGEGKAPRARSTRIPLSQLAWTGKIDK
jgi:nitroreductase